LKLAVLSVISDQHLAYTHGRKVDELQPNLVL